MTDEKPSLTGRQCKVIPSSLVEGVRSLKVLFSYADQYTAGR
jgi:hypothetical protein